MQTKLTYDNALRCCEKVLISGGFYKADVFLTNVEGQRFIVKDYSRKGFWERNLVGRLVISREAAAYEALRGAEGVPAVSYRLSPFTFAVEYLDGADLGSLERGQLGPEMVLRFERVVAGLHARGWVHLDLHRRTNILSVDGKIYVVDLASALHTGAVPVLGGILTFLFGLADRLSLIKMKTIFGPELLSPGEQRWLRLRNLFMPIKWH